VSLRVVDRVYFCQDKSELSMILKLHNWRCFEQVDFGLPTEPIVIVDRNGSGKTSLLSAIYSLFTGLPFPETKFIFCLKQNTTYFGLQILNQPKAWFLNGKLNPSLRLTLKWEKPELLKLGFAKSDVPANAVQIFTYLPTDNYWLKLGRADKLRLLDDLLAQIYWPNYSHHLKRLQQTQTQKLAIIRHCKQHNQPLDYSLYLTYSQLLFEHSVKLWHYRANFFRFWQTHLPKLNTWLERAYNDWQIYWEITSPSGHRQPLASLTKPTWEPPDWTKLASQELAAEKLLYGAQRDDFKILCNQTDCINVLSRGEMRSLILFSKHLASQLNAKPYTIWLLDDVFNELDSSREQIILQTMLQQASWFVATATKNLDYLSVPKYSLSDLLKTPKPS
jgi:recombinational DNA repair ATPase RecF